jgi:hypothetical protein
MDQVFVLWDCRVRSHKPLDIWKLILEATGHTKPTTLLILQPPETEIPAPIQTAMRMTNSKVFVGLDSVDFCFLELCLAIATNPEARIVVLSDDVNTFGRAFRTGQAKQVVFLTSQRLSWPLSDAKWSKGLQFTSLARRGKSQ